MPEEAQRYFVANEQELALLGKSLAKELQEREIIFLYGPIGSGKTALARSIIRSLVADEGLVVRSPTFSIVQAYEGDIYHLDLYRLNTVEEFTALGLQEYFYEVKLVLVEWPELAAKVIGEPTVSITIESVEAGRLLIVKRRHTVLNS